MNIEQRIDQAITTIRATAREQSEPVFDEAAGEWRITSAITGVTHWGATEDDARAQLNTELRLTRKMIDRRSPALISIAERIVKPDNVTPQAVL